MLRSLLIVATPYRMAVHAVCDMGLLRLVGSWTLYVSFAEYSLFYRAFLQRKPMILRSLLIVPTPYWMAVHEVFDGKACNTCMVHRVLWLSVWGVMGAWMATHATHAWFIRCHDSVCGVCTQTWHVDIWTRHDVAHIWCHDSVCVKWGVIRRYLNGLFSCVWTKYVDMSNRRDVCHIWCHNSVCVKWAVIWRSSTVCSVLYGVATMSWLLKSQGLFCKRALLKRRYSAKET